MKNRGLSLASIIRSSPNAGAIISGRVGSNIKGTIRFYRADNGGTVVLVQISGLPTSNSTCRNGFLGFHIHEGKSCVDKTETAFEKTGSHYNPTECPHPFHLGDMPPLLNCDGTAFSMFLTNRFTPEEIIGKTVVIHSQADDFKTQPGGDSGIKIACGEIIRL